MSTISNKQIWNIAYPIMFGNLAQTLIALTDTAFLGRVGEIELGASAIAGVYYYVFSTLAWGFSIGIQVIIARRLGEKKYNRIGVVFEHGLVFVFFMSLILFCVLKFFSGPILHNFISSPQIYNAIVEYLNYRPYGIIFVGFNFLFRGMYIGLSKTAVIGVTTAVMAFVNVLFNYLLIFGHFGFPKMGIGGAALASVMAEISATIFFTIYTIKKLPLKKYALFSFHKLEGWVIKMVLKIALPTMFQKLISFGTWMLFFIMVENMGERPIAISMIVRSVYMLIAVPVFAFGAATNTLTSRFIGEGRASMVNKLTNRIFLMSILCVIPVIAICVCFPEAVLSIYTDSPELIASSVPSLYVVCISVISMAFSMTYFEAISGTGHTTHALIAELGALVFYVASIWIFASYLKSPVEYVWSSEIVYGVILGVLSVSYMKLYNWKKTNF